MLEWKKVYNYDVKVEDGKVILIVKQDGTTGYPYKYDEKQRASVLQEGLTFEKFRNGMYKGIYEIW